MRLGIFTKPIHVEKIVNYLNQWTDILYTISTVREEVDLFEYDIGVSYCWPWKVKDTTSRKWYNYHPGLLPNHKGRDCYVKAILDGKFGVTLHRMDDDFDTGEILRVVEFEASPVNTQELGNLYHTELFNLFKDTIEGIADYD